MNRQKTALLSVYRKKGPDGESLLRLARYLISQGWALLASGGTARFLAEAGVSVRDVAELVGGGAILGHKVVTLSRELHAGLLADLETELAELESLGLLYIDLVCVDLYPLQEAIRNPEATPASVRKDTDIGGPTMLRSGAKGQRIVICDLADRDRVLDWLEAGEPDREAFITELVAKAEATVASYCLDSGRYHSQGRHDGMVGMRVCECSYGENGWQTPAGLYTTGTGDPLALDQFTLVAGSAPSYNNLVDLERLTQTGTHVAAAFDSNYGEVPLIALGGKHGNCCGAAIGSRKERTTVLQKMINGDPRAIFGGLVWLNFLVDEAVAELLLSYNVPTGRRILDGIIAPWFEPAAVEMLRRKGDKCRFLANPALSCLGQNSLDRAPRFRYVRGGFLLQPNYTYLLDLNDPALEKCPVLGTREERDLLLAWGIGSTSNSNTVTLVYKGSLVGNGVGQQDRVGGCQLAIARAGSAGHETRGCVAYSDSFFPFTDGPEELAQAGIIAILASSGSVRDDAVRAFCREHNVALYLIPDATGRGFYGH
ncbi:MAG: hypothetical protein WC935_07025 [Thermoleophilia bacterium]